MSSFASLVASVPKGCSTFVLVRNADIVGDLLVDSFFLDFPAFKVGGEVGEADEVGALVVGSSLFSFLALEDIMVG